MKPAPEVQSLLEEWRRLTVVECEAILRADWAGLAAQQQEKLGLQSRIDDALHHSADAVRPNRPTSSGFDSLVAEIVALETRNRDLLSSKRTAKETELHQISRTNLTLQGVRRAYGGLCGYQWQSYS